MQDSCQLAGPLSHDGPALLLMNLQKDLHAAAHKNDPNPEPGTSQPVPIAHMHFNCCQEQPKTCHSVTDSGELCVTTTWPTTLPQPDYQLDSLKLMVMVHHHNTAVQ